VKLRLEEIMQFDMQQSGPGLCCVQRSGGESPNINFGRSFLPFHCPGFGAFELCRFSPRALINFKNSGSGVLVSPCLARVQIFRNLAPLLEPSLIISNKSNSNVEHHTRVFKSFRVKRQKQTFFHIQEPHLNLFSP
jgi:hypothetical protein